MSFEMEGMVQLILPSCPSSAHRIPDATPLVHSLCTWGSDRTCVMLAGDCKPFLGCCKSWWEWAGVRKEVPVVGECWMWCWRTPGTLWLDKKCCVRRKGGRSSSSRCASTAQGGDTGQDWGAGAPWVLPEGKLDLPKIPTGSSKGTLQSWLGMALLGQGTFLAPIPTFCVFQSMPYALRIFLMHLNTHINYFSPCTCIKTSVWPSLRNRDFPKSLTWSCCPHLTLAGYFILNSCGVLDLALMSCSYQQANFNFFNQNMMCGASRTLCMCRVKLFATKEFPNTELLVLLNCPWIWLGWGT